MRSAFHWLREEIYKLRYLRHGFRNYYCGEDMPALRRWVVARKIEDIMRRDARCN